MRNVLIWINIHKSVQLFLPKWAYLKYKAYEVPTGSPLSNKYP